ncbi:twin-arginine translocase subunit TatC [Alkalicaulis satelles]|uniref:Sec-independent protein translocase protein TatC n=1 Tax=Alkalicaulis satelles TaxID=2609175 RepID=A0A5M6ZJL8_9PROT|nr:twin-arginine translocase subunit TatC [Alkalicaulis satelles]KAA5804979.1 twin-arginine translocase subunit TatC [Alkalicaulis satelles]
MGGPRKEEDEVEASRAPLMAHLEELRSRLIVTLGALAAGFVLCFLAAEAIYNFLLVPFETAARQVRGEDLQLQLIFTAPLEFFFVKLKLALFGAVIVTFPILAYQVWAFVRPGLYKNERLAFAPFLVAAPVLFVAGMALVYYFILPFVMSFALGQEQAPSDGRASIQLLTRVSEYLNLVTTLTLAFGISFQLPVLLSLLGKAGLITSQTLIKSWKYAVVGIAAFAAFVTPPDPISQIFLGAAMFGLYGLSILAVKLVEPKPEAEEETA